MSAPEFAIEWLLTRDDLLRESAWEQRANRSRDLMRRAFGLLNIALGGYLIWRGFGWYSSFCILLGAWWLLWPYPLFWLAWFVYWIRGRDVPQPETRLRLELLNDGIRFSSSVSPDNATCFPWSTLQSVARDDQDYHVEFAGGQRLHLPRSAFRTPAEDDWFLGAIQQRLPTDQSAHPVAR